jgi:alkaline phosphatase D
MLDSGQPRRDVMPIQIDRRTLLMTGGLGLGALILPGGSIAAQALMAARGFTHNVASGEPGPNSMLLWTRYVPAISGATKVRVEVSETPEFTRIVTGGQMVTGPWRDYTAKITVDGLQPGRRYHYRFVGPDGSISPVGRTKTLPAGKVSRFNIAIFSCSNLGFGHFNAYAHAAQRNDIDLALHMGDYIYEYARGGYDAGAANARTLQIEPATEILSLADYRLRYASYRSDPDLQALHQNVAVIPNTDDHEGANDTWEGGAQNHQDNEGDWNTRRNAAMQVWREWMPVGEQPWKTYDIGELATYVRTDTRMIARSRPNSYGEIVKPGENMAAALAAFRDGPWLDDAATMFGTEQEAWVARELRTSTRTRKTWQIVGSGTNMGYNSTPLEALNWIDAKSAQRTRDYVTNGVEAGNAGLPYNLDNWGGYPKARARFLSSAQNAGANLIVVTGDSHNGWAFDLPGDGKPAGVEFGGHSVSSPGFESATGTIAPKDIARAMLSRSKELRWADTSNRGYMLLSLTPLAATNEWVFMQTVRAKTLEIKASHKMKVRPGRGILETA